MQCRKVRGYLICVMLTTHTLVLCCNLQQAMWSRITSLCMQTSDWSRRPLSPQQLHYASLDAAVQVHLLVAMCRGAAVSRLELRMLCRDWSREGKRGRAGASRSGHGGSGGDGGDDDDDTAGSGSSGGERGDGAGIGGMGGGGVAGRESGGVGPGERTNGGDGTGGYAAGSHSTACSGRGTAVTPVSTDHSRVSQHRRLAAHQEEAARAWLDRGSSEPASAWGGCVAPVVNAFGCLQLEAQTRASGDPTMLATASNVPSTMAAWVWHVLRMHLPPCGHLGRGEPLRIPLGGAASLASRTPLPADALARLLLSAAAAALRTHVPVPRAALWRRCGLRGGECAGCGATSIGLGAEDRAMHGASPALQRCACVVAANTQGRGWGLGSRSKRRSEVVTGHNACAAASWGAPAVRLARARPSSLMRLRSLPLVI